MTSEAEASPPHDGAPVLWITGLSGVGKSTLARALVERLRSSGERPLLLDGDALRAALDEPGAADDHGIASRRARAWRIARLAAFAAQQQVPVVVATISLYADVQEWNRRSIPRFGEVLLMAPIDVLRARNPALYGSTVEPEVANVVGIDLEPEFPRVPDLVLDQDFMCASLEAHVLEAIELWHRIGRGREEGP